MPGIIISVISKGFFKQEEDKHLQNLWIEVEVTLWCPYYQSLLHNKKESLLILGMRIFLENSINVKEKLLWQ